MISSEKMTFQGLDPISCRAKFAVKFCRASAATIAALGRARVGGRHICGLSCDIMFRLGLLLTVINVILDILQKLNFVLFHRTGLAAVSSQAGHAWQLGREMPQPQQEEWPWPRQHQV